ncbi:MAG: alpha/beta fold hydrolase, partial [Alphaproteobacteria bacterium]
QPQGNPRLARWLHRIRVPTLVLWGAEDRLRPTAQSDTWLALLPDGQAEIVPATGHLVLEETPAAANIVAEFLTRKIPPTPQRRTEQDD